MSRTLSATLREAAFAQETGEVFLPLLTITHPQIADPIRVVRDGADLTSRSNVFVAFPFDIELPDDNPDAPPKAKLTIDNVSRDIGDALNRIRGFEPPTVLIEIVLASAPDAVEISFPDFEMSNVRADASQVTADLTVENLTAEPYPAGNFIPSLFPGLF